MFDFWNKYPKKDKERIEKESAEIMEILSKCGGSLHERDWVIKDDTMQLKGNEITFELNRKIDREISTLDGIKEITFIDQYPVIIFLGQSIIGIGNSNLKNNSDVIIEDLRKALFKGKFEYKYLESDEIHLRKLEDDKTVELVGFKCKSAMGIDSMSGMDRYEIRNKKIYEEACTGLMTTKVCAKIFPQFGKVKFSIRNNGLITIFRHSLSSSDAALILPDLLKYLILNDSFTRTLVGF